MFFNKYNLFGLVQITTKTNKAVGLYSIATFTDSLYHFLIQSLAELLQIEMVQSGSL